MPELPEVETTRAGLAPHLVGRTVVATTLRRPDLRWPIARELVDRLPGHRIDAVRRMLASCRLPSKCGHFLGNQVHRDAPVNRRERVGSSRRTAAPPLGAT